MTDEVLLFVLAAAVLLATATAAAAALRLNSPVSFLLSVYVLAVAEVVAATEVLSFFHEVDASGYLAAEGVLLVVAAGAWLARGRPRPPLPRPGLGAARRHRLVTALAALVVASLAFQVFLVVATPPNNPDSLSYHLPRTAEWYFRGAVERYPVYDERHNAFPPNAEIQVLYTFAFLDRDTLAAAPQLLARLALLLAVYGLSRLAGFARPAAAFASFVFSSLTLVVVQAVTTQNDLIVAALVAATAYFALEAVLRDPRAAVPAGLAVGLAVGTKWTGAAAIPALVVIVLAASRDVRRLARLAVTGAAGLALVGIYSYARNFSATTSPLGRAGELGGVQTDPSGSTFLTTAYRIVVDFADFSSYYQNANEDTSYYGTLGWLLVLPLSAAFVAAWALRRTQPVRGALALAIPILVVELAITHPYNRFEGRLLIGAVALCIPLAAWTYRHAWVRRGVAAIAAATLVLAVLFNQAKPVGVTGGTPVWELPRISAQSLKSPDYDAVFSIVDARVPRGGPIGAVLRGGVWIYPLYGPTLDRRVVYLPADDPLGEAERLGIENVVFSSERLLNGERASWRITPLGSAGWLLAQQAPSQ